MQLLADDKRFSWLSSSRRSNNPPSLLMRSPLKLSSIFLPCIGKRLSSVVEISVFLSIIVQRASFVIITLNITD